MGMVRRDNKAVLNNVMRWMASEPAAHGMLEVFQECYRRLGDRCGIPGKEDDHRCFFFDQGTSGVDTISISSQCVIPAFMYGSYYKHAIVREVVRAYRGWKMHDFNCPCRSPSFDGKCACREATSNLCACHTGLRPYYRPEYKQINPGKPLFDAASRGLLHWVNWLLWAGADATNKPTEESLLFWARRGGIYTEVAELLVRHGWELQTLTIFPRAAAIRKDAVAHPSHSVPSEDIQGEDESTKVEPEVWAAGSEQEDSPWVAISDVCGSRFWEAW